jgi:molecular chaperone GrpE (heat shock protein)
MTRWPRWACSLIPAEGELFDPNLHQAVQMVETSETEDNHVIDELQRGYKLKDRLLRPAMVRVARNPEVRQILRRGPELWPPQ